MSERISEPSRRISPEDIAMLDSLELHAGWFSYGKNSITPFSVARFAFTKRLHQQIAACDPETIPRYTSLDESHHREGQLIRTDEGYGFLRSQTYTPYGRTQKEPVAYTYQSYYCHSDPDIGLSMGPGWDFRRELCDPDYALRRHGRTFTVDEVWGNNGAQLPDETALFITKIPNPTLDLRRQ